jgi:hypothetical protein
LKIKLRSVCNCFTGQYYFSISQATGEHLLNILEVAFSFGGVDIAGSALKFSGSSYHNNVVGQITFGAAALANDGSLKTCFHSSTIDAVPKLRVVVPYCFDSIRIYRRTDCCANRLDGAVLNIYADALMTQLLYSYAFPVNTPAVTTLSLQLQYCTQQR